MIQVQISTPDYHTTYFPTVSNFVWETYRKNAAGVLYLTILKQDSFQCELGYHVDVYDMDTSEPEHLLSYRIYEQTLRNNQDLIIVAYDQLYQWIHSRESTFICRPRNLTRRWRSQRSKYIRNRDQLTAKEYVKQWIHEKFMDYGDYLDQNEDRKLKRGVIPSDLILHFSSLYGLEVDFVDYTDCIAPFDPENSSSEAGYVFVANNLSTQIQMPISYKSDKIGYFVRVTKRESVLDIIQSYIDYNPIYLGEIYVLYDGGKGLCYRKREHMRTYLLVTVDNSGEYIIQQKLPKDYANYVQFNVHSNFLEDIEEPPHTNDADFVATITPEQREIWESNYQKSVMKEKMEKFALLVRDTKEFDFAQDSRIRQLGIFKDVIELGSESQSIVNTMNKIKSTGLNFLEKIGITVSSTTTSTKGINKKNIDIYKRILLYYQVLNEDFDHHLTLRGVKGSWKVRGGSIIGIHLPTFNGKTLQMEVWVHSVRHTYKSKEDHTMDIEVVEV